ncbi:malate dehydrogenase, cytoplasmic-like [Gigantopelta aegis]|uniref:malate dehydrogenase, cytoplasmic-like n=1 Tax=Gigantopelta aegis TaxID=1735272 RepID=UPI001B88A2A9|nr:malate dehydrogenase, cytoplasmic-like [Gigantopelta aegis]
MGCGASSVNLWDKVSPLKVLITEAASQVAYLLVLAIAKGDVFGQDKPISLFLMDIPSTMDVVKGVVLELLDCVLPLLKRITATSDASVAFKDIDFALLVCDRPFRAGLGRKDLIYINVPIFMEHGAALNHYSKKRVKVVVVGTVANTMAWVTSKYAPSIPKQNFSSVTRLGQNRAQSLIARHLRIPPTAVTKVIIWGNNSTTQFPDVRLAKAVINGRLVEVPRALDASYLKQDFITNVQQRTQEILQLRKLTSALSVANATCDHMRDWYFGTGDSWVSMAVISDNNPYGVPDDIVYSFPLVIKDGRWQFVDVKNITEFQDEHMLASTHELMKEKKVALAAFTHDHIPSDDT